MIFGATLTVPGGVLLHTVSCGREVLFVGLLLVSMIDCQGVLETVVVEVKNGCAVFCIHPSAFRASRRIARELSHYSVGRILVRAVALNSAGDCLHDRPVYGLYKVRSGISWSITGITFSHPDKTVPFLPTAELRCGGMIPTSRDSGYWPSHRIDGLCEGEPDVSTNLMLVAVHLSAARVLFNIKLLFRFRPGIGPLSNGGYDPSVVAPRFVPDVLDVGFFIRTHVCPSGCFSVVDPVCAHGFGITLPTDVFVAGSGFPPCPICRSLPGAALSA